MPLHALGVLNSHVTGEWQARRRAAVEAPTSRIPPLLLNMLRRIYKAPKVGTSPEVLGPASRLMPHQILNSAILKIERYRIR